MCKRVRLDYFDIENMTIGFCLDYIDEWIEQQKPEEEKTRIAGQSDFDNF